MIDEFQHASNYRKKLGTMLDVFKTALEKRANVSFVVSGSRVHYLRDILGRAAARCLATL